MFSRVNVKNIIIFKACLRVVCIGADLPISEFEYFIHKKYIQSIELVNSFFRQTIYKYYFLLVLILNLILLK